MGWRAGSEDRRCHLRHRESVLSNPRPERAPNTVHSRRLPSFPRAHDLRKRDDEPSQLQNRHHPRRRRRRRCRRELQIRRVLLEGSALAARDKNVIHAASSSRDASHRSSGLTMVPTNPACGCSAFTAARGNLLDQGGAARAQPADEGADAHLRRRPIPARRAVLEREEHADVTDCSRPPEQVKTRRCEARLPGASSIAAPARCREHSAALRTRCGGTRRRASTIASSLGAVLRARRGLPYLGADLVDRRRALATKEAKAERLIRDFIARRQVTYRESW